MPNTQWEYLEVKADEKSIRSSPHAYKLQAHVGKPLFHVMNFLGKEGWEHTCTLVMGTDYEHEDEGEQIMLHFKRPLGWKHP
ncbi:hypothetical protein KW786_02755 [Candidatus Parcubacteria bacterium]|nr:hypothetical protein [Candidatus Parcubacteria bacterium]